MRLEPGGKRHARERRRLRAVDGQFAARLRHRQPVVIRPSGNTKAGLIEKEIRERAGARRGIRRNLPGSRDIRPSADCR
ncbi:hypothetical protein [Burkholderia metallica]|uniref:hypothetical protein n=1 Tax=Burkholderia metallica TaxID=488729 RepID=UPI0015840540|nr:hypothetical protein [Burkholderia metallica]